MGVDWSPDTALGLLGRAARLAELKGNLSEIEEEARRFAAIRGAFREKVIDLCREFGRPAPADDELAAQEYPLDAALKANATRRSWR